MRLIVTAADIERKISDGSPSRRRRHEIKNGEKFADSFSSLSSFFCSSKGEIGENRNIVFTGNCQLEAGDYFARSRYPMITTTVASVTMMPSTNPGGSNHSE